MQRASWLNFSHSTFASHSERYERAEEYVDVIYKLLEGSWEDGAVLRDAAGGVYADPGKVHNIAHTGKYYSVPGIHTNEPSPQRTPVLFQAGTSEDGRQFSSRNAEAIFMTSYNPAGARKVVADLHRRIGEWGRRPSDVLIFQHLNFIVGSTEAEAKRKDAEALEYLSSETYMAFFSSVLDADLGAIDLDTPIGDFKTEALQGQLKALAEAAPDKSWTFREFVFSITTSRFVGTPEQIADELEAWRAVGVNGINVSYMTGAEDVHAFLDHVTPVLKKRGLMQTEYARGTMREKLYAGVEGLQALISTTVTRAPGIAGRVS
jgi:FMN-dependent oxidoreductase (nitrilotriacetate monooxygenase family)